jgi:hypothetical protein
MEPYGISTGLYAKCTQFLDVYKVEGVRSFGVFFSPNYFYHLRL